MGITRFKYNLQIPESTFENIFFSAIFLEDYFSKRLGKDTLLSLA